MDMNDPEQFEYTYTVGMTDEEVEARLAEAETGVLSLADDGDAYGIPLAYHWDGESFVFRLGVHPGSEKLAFLEATERASFLVYDYEPPDESWSVMAFGRVRELPAERATELDEREEFLPLRIFGEPMDEVEPTLYEFVVESMTGRQT